MRLGIFGGTFDPPHFGHLCLAEAARTQLKLERVLWVLTAQPPHKQGRALSPVAVRLALVEAALAGEPAFALSRVDIDRPGPHWAADTVALLARQYPQDELIYLLGGDSLRDLPRWGRPAEFLAHCRLGVLRRPEADFDLAALEKIFPGLSAKVEFVQAPPSDLASHVIRRRVRAGLPIAGLAPEPVLKLIMQHHLYLETP